MLPSVPSRPRSRFGLTRRDALRAGLGGAIALGLAACGNGIRGRSLALTRTSIPYGADPQQSGDLTIPSLDGTLAVLVLVHGGYWRVGFDRSELNDLADDLARTGYAVWNIGYRRVGDPGGGWPGTFTDVAAAIDHLATIAEANRLDLERVAVLGHSAGGGLALWAGARRKLEATDPGAGPKVATAAAISLSGVVDLVASASLDETAGERELQPAVIALMGGTPEQVPMRYARTSPLALLPLGTPQLLIHGAKDDRVPIRQSQVYVASAKAGGDAAELIELPNGTHLDITSPTHAGWDDLVAWLRATIGDPTK